MLSVGSLDDLCCSTMWVRRMSALRSSRKAAAKKHAPRIAPMRNIARSPDPAGCVEEAEVIPLMIPEVGVGAGLGLDRRGGACMILAFVGIGVGVSTSGMIRAANPCPSEKTATAVCNSDSNSEAPGLPAAMSAIMRSSRNDLRRSLLSLSSIRLLPKDGDMALIRAKYAVACSGIRLHGHCGEFLKVLVAFSILSKVSVGRQLTSMLWY